VYWFHYSEFVCRLFEPISFRTEAAYLSQARYYNSCPSFHQCQPSNRRDLHHHRSARQTSLLCNRKQQLFDSGKTEKPSLCGNQNSRTKFSKVGQATPIPRIPRFANSCVLWKALLLEKQDANVFRLPIFTHVCVCVCVCVYECKRRERGNWTGISVQGQRDRDLRWKTRSSGCCNNRRTATAAKTTYSLHTVFLPKPRSALFWNRFSSCLIQIADAKNLYRM